MLVPGRRVSMEKNEKLMFGDETRQTGKPKMLVKGGLDGEKQCFLSIKREMKDKKLIF